MRHKRKLSVLLLGVTCLSVFSNLTQVMAFNAGDVIINEVAWAGSADASTDEWIELYNNTAQEIDLANWVIEDDGNPLKIAAGKIPANGYFLIEKKEKAVDGIAADVLMPLSLANSGDSLVLKDDQGNTIDTVNSGGGAWFAGDSAAKSTMERIDSKVDGNLATNWKTNVAGNNAKASGGSLIKGTPKSANSVKAVSANAAKVLISGNDHLKVGATYQATVKVENVKNLSAYGLEINYDPAILEFVKTVPGDFLNAKSTVNTSFQSGLEAGKSGKLLVAEAVIDPKKTVAAGDGILLVLEFKALAKTDQTEILFSPTSFLADADQDIESAFGKITLKVNPQSGGGSGSLGEVKNLTAKDGAKRYEISLEWDAVSEAEKYRIYRKSSDGNFKQIAEVNTEKFVDNDAVANGGNLIPNLEYEYKVVAVKGADQSTGVIAKFIDKRGLKADIDRSDRVDGRDLELMARGFGQDSSNSKFNVRADLNFDGIIDGKDLIVLGSEWALKYSSQ